MKKKKETPPQQIVRKCRTCYFATLIQFCCDPLLAECAHKEPEDRQVANARNGCPLYLQNPNPNPVIHRYENIHSRRANPPKQAK